MISYDSNSLMISVDGTVATTLPEDGNYYLTDYVCNNPNTVVKWDRNLKYLSISNGRDGGSVSCDLTFESKPLISKMPIGSYVAYVGDGGMVGDDSVFCKNNGELSSNVMTLETEASNSCLGQNAREDLESSNLGTYGFCNSSDYKYYVTGWRILYTVKDKAIIVSAGSPECINKDSDDYISELNTSALKYCNMNFVDGSCNCADLDDDGFCDEASSDAWAINDNDFYNVTKVINGTGNRLTRYSSVLGESSNYCYLENDNKTSLKECGYNNDLLDNGGFYWFAAKASLNNNNVGILWNANYRHIGISSSNNSYGLRPVISLSSSVYVVDGSGTLDDPYIIEN